VIFECFDGIHDDCFFSIGPASGFPALFLARGRIVNKGLGVLMAEICAYQGDNAIHIRSIPAGPARIFDVVFQHAAAAIRPFSGMPLSARPQGRAGVATTRTSP
jgi:hypothetical protein